MQYLEDIKQMQEYDLKNWQFGYINRFHHEPWKRKARKMRNRRSKEVKRKEHLIQLVINEQHA